MINDVDLRLLFESVLDTAVDGIIIIDAKGIVINVNQAVVRLFEYQKSEVIGQNVRMLMNRDDASKHDQYLERYNQTKEARVIGIGRQVIARAKSGNLFPVQLAVSEVMLNDRIIFTGIIHDLSDISKALDDLEELNRELDKRVVDRTYQVEKVVNQLLSTNNKLKKEVKERVEAEQLLRQKEEELQKALSSERVLNELKSRFVSTASHEFRTPLATILSSASIILKYTKEEEQVNREKHVSKIKNAVNHLTGLLNDFLSLSRLEEGRVNIMEEQVSLASVLEEVREDLSGVKKQNQEIVFSPDSSFEVNTDKHILKNILFNILSNAIKYSDTNIDAVINPQEEGFCISIADKGIGIPNDDQRHLFTRFFRATNVGNVQGTGLGLNIVKRYCELIGATIDIQSEYGEGTTVNIIIPKYFNHKRDEENSGH
ncbi:MAG: PAS domain S-box protein [Saprospiraceae bacterium]|nr:PAS domain S-box protein [Saprospiraceae bacterium]